MIRQNTTMYAREQNLNLGVPTFLGSPPPPPRDPTAPVTPNELSGRAQNRVKRHSPCSSNIALKTDQASKRPRYNRVVAIDVSGDCVPALDPEISLQSSLSSSDDDPVPEGQRGADSLSVHDSISAQKVTLSMTKKDYGNIVPTPAKVTEMATRKAHEPICVVQLPDGQWLCKVCITTLFDNFGDACAHEAKCKLSRTEKVIDEDEHKGRPNADEVEALNSCIQSVREDKVENTQSIPGAVATGDATQADVEHSLKISLLPPDSERHVLSDYNYLLTQNIEFFEVPSNSVLPKQGYCGGYGGVGGTAADLWTSVAARPAPPCRIGLRCVHCAQGGRIITAASFFPSSTGSIASGLGTIGARHFAGGRCPSVPANTLDAMRRAKRTSQIQTRTHGRVGLDAYCKNLARRGGIANDPSGGIYLPESGPTMTVDRADIGSSGENIPSTVIRSSNGEDRFATLLAVARSEQGVIGSCAVADLGGGGTTRTEKGLYGLESDASLLPFVPGNVPYFWECGRCNSVPVAWRASGSVVFCSGPPPSNMTQAHLNCCNGDAPLRVPRDATIDMVFGLEERAPSIRISWDGRKLLRKSERFKRRTYCVRVIGSPRRRSAPVLTDNVNSGVEEMPLVFIVDKPLTTDFAYFTMEQLKKCYLTKAGGSRGTCPVGYPGLACAYCAGQPTERRFFYTSADHLRNSFSHIPAHLVECSRCPDEVKQNLEIFKALRNKQKAQLKMGFHKIFIDHVWERLHGPGGGRVEKEPAPEEEFDDFSDDDSSLGDISDLCDVSYPARADVRMQTYEAEDLSIYEHESSVLILPGDRYLTTGYVYLSLLQVDPYHFTGRDVSQGRCSFPVGFPGLICKYCKENDNICTFFSRSSDHLRNVLGDISNHIMNCKSCPSHIKSKLTSLKLLRQAQESRFKRGMQMSFVDNVWSRLIMLDRSDKPSCVATTVSNSSSQLVYPDDLPFVTDFTFFTMQQMMPCSLEASGNGARSTFEYGFPGLACLHCSGNQGARKFFYRTAEILGGNYAHIPNHLMSCRHCPLHVKGILEEKKKFHALQKAKLSRGSQRIFFTRVWNRLHANSHCPKQSRVSLTETRIQAAPQKPLENRFHRVHCDATQNSFNEVNPTELKPCDTEYTNGMKAEITLMRPQQDLMVPRTEPSQNIIEQVKTPKSIRDIVLTASQGDNMVNATIRERDEYSNERNETKEHSQ